MSIRVHLRPKKLALRELEPLASALLTVLLTLNLTGVASKKSQFLQLGSQFDIELQQSPSNSQLGGSGLTRGTAAGRVNQDVELVGSFGGQQGLPHNGTRCIAWEVVLK